MEEKDLLEETTVTENAEATEAVNEETEAAEAAVEEVAEETVPSDEETDAETVSGEYVVASSVEASEEVKASKKTTAVLVTMIIILVAIIAFAGVLIFNKIKADKQKAEEDAKVQEILDAAQAEAEKNAENTAATEPKEEVVYNVTVKLGEYKGIEGKMVVAEVTEEDIQDDIDSFCDMNEEEVEITDRPVEDGDTLNIDYAGFMDEEQFEGGTAEGAELVIGSGSFIDGFESQLIGHAVGEVVDIDVTFPDPYPNNPDYAGKPARFTVTINAIYNYVVPEFSDELVAANSEYATMSEYIAGRTKEMEEENAEMAREQFENDIIEEAIARCEFGGDIDAKIADYENQYTSYNDYLAQSYYGIDGATLFYYFYGMDNDAYYAYINEQSTYQTKYEAMLNEIIKVENLTVTPEEYEKEFNDMFLDYYGYASKEEVLADISQEEIDDMVNNTVLQDKARQIIIDNAVIIE